MSSRVQGLVLDVVTILEEELTLAAPGAAGQPGRALASGNGAVTVRSQVDHATE